jgi:hypothetical protein
MQDATRRTSDTQLTRGSVRQRDAHDTHRPLSYPQLFGRARRSAAACLGSGRPIDHSEVAPPRAFWEITPVNPPARHPPAKLIWLTAHLSPVGVCVHLVSFSTLDRVNLSPQEYPDPATPFGGFQDDRNPPSIVPYSLPNIDWRCILLA